MTLFRASAYPGELLASLFIPKLFDNNSIEQWKAEGSKDVKEGALAPAERLLAEYVEARSSQRRRAERLHRLATREIRAVDALK